MKSIPQISHKEGPHAVLTKSTPMVEEAADVAEEIMVAVVLVVVEVQEAEVARGVVKIITRSNILCA